MPAVQTTYLENIAPGVEGMIASGWGGSMVSETRICETAAGIGFGRAVSQGSGAKGAIVGGTTAGFLGITIRDVTLVTKAGQSVDIYQRYDNMGILNSGDIWVTAVAAVTAGVSPALFDGTTGQIGVATGQTIAGSRWLTGATAGQLAALRLTRAHP